MPDGIWLEALGSRHGTTVNGQLIAEQRLLASGDVITVGTVLLIVRRPLRARGLGAMLDGPALLRRIEDEIERALRYQRELSLVVVRAEVPLDRVRVAAAVGARLRLIDAAAFL